MYTRQELLALRGDYTRPSGDYPLEILPAQASNAPMLNGTRCAVRALCGSGAPCAPCACALRARADWSQARQSKRDATSTAMPANPKAQSNANVNANADDAERVQTHESEKEQTKKKKKEKQIETDEKRLASRQKQIDIGINTDGYRNFMLLVESGQCKLSELKIPNKLQVCSKRSWDGQIRIWRRALHSFDPNPNAPLDLDSN
jgi:hypothetical protein